LGSITYFFIDELREFFPNDLILRDVVLLFRASREDHVTPGHLDYGLCLLIFDFVSVLLKYLFGGIPLLLGDIGHHPFLDFTDVSAGITYVLELLVCE